MRFFLFTIAVLLLWAPALQASTIEQQREWFQQARKALNLHQIKQFHRLKDKLDGYSLTPYLDIWHAGKLLKKGDDSMVAAVLLAYADVPETINLRRRWLKHLAKKGHWVDVRPLFEESPNLAARFPEIAMVADWNTGYEQDAIVQFTQRWVQGKSFTAATEPLHQVWRQLGHPSPAERWMRIGSFASKKHWSKVNVLVKGLPKHQQRWPDYWRKIQKNPGDIAQTWPKSMLEADALIPAIMIVKDVIRRLSRRDISKAWQVMQQLKSKAVFQQQQSQDVADMFVQLERTVALRAARKHEKIALDWLAHLPLSVQNEDTRAWQVRLAAIVQNWPAVLAAIASMPQQQHQQDRWLYWQARAWDGLGQPKQAEEQFSRLAQGRGYYNFLSADHIGVPFHIESSTIQVADQILTEVEAMPAMSRVSEWLEVGKRSKAIREWHFALAGADTEHWKAAALLAIRWKWDDQVIRAAFKANALDALQSRFPMSYKTIVMKESRRTGLSPAFIWSIIRQESAFNQHAVSYVGAKGLMQLMPATARHVARQLKMPKGTPRLFSAAVNIRLGAKYLADVNHRFGNSALAAAGYNAGPHRVSTWLERVSFDSPEAWVEAIPFNETRRYVQQVMAFMAVYEWRLNKQPSSLRARLKGRVQKVSWNQSVTVYERNAKE